MGNCCVSERYSDMLLLKDDLKDDFNDNQTKVKCVYCDSVGYSKGYFSFKKNNFVCYRCRED